MIFNELYNSAQLLLLLLSNSLSSLVCFSPTTMLWWRKEPFCIDNSFHTDNFHSFTWILSSHHIYQHSLPIVATPLLVEMCKKYSHEAAAAIVDERSGGNEHERTSETEIYVSQPFQKIYIKMLTLSFFLFLFRILSPCVFFSIFTFFDVFRLSCKWKISPHSPTESVPSLVHAPLLAIISSTRNAETGKSWYWTTLCIVNCVENHQFYQLSSTMLFNFSSVSDIVYTMRGKFTQKAFFKIDFMYRSHRFFQSYFSFSLNKLSRSSAKHIQNFI